MVKDLINERDAGDYAIGEAHPTPTAVVKKPPTTQGQNFNIPSKLEVSLSSCAKSHLIS